MATKQRANTKIVSSNEIGQSGTTIFNGIISGEEYNDNLIGRRALEIYDEMRRGDATVHAALTAIKEPIKAAEWFVTPASDDPQDKAAADLAEYNLKEVLNWNATLSEILTHLDFGFSVHEEVYEPRQVDGVDRIVLGKLGYRKQTTIYKWEMDDHQPGVTQMLSTGKTYQIPQEKIAIFTNQREGDNYEGISVLRTAYQHWYYKKTFYQIDAIAHERQALGVVKIKHPTGAAKKDLDSAHTAARNIRANEEAFIDEPNGWDINFMDMMARTIRDIEPSINHHDRQITKNVLAQFLEIGAAGATGTRSTSEDHSRLFELALQAIAQNIADTFNERVMRTLIDLNFNVTDYPKLSFGKIGDTNLPEVSDAVAKFVTAGVITPGPQDEEYVRKLLRFPSMPDDAPKSGASGTAPKNEAAATAIEDDALLADARKLYASITGLLYGDAKQAA